MYELRFSEGVEEDLRAIPVQACGTILDAVERQLSQEPEAPTRNRKILVGLVPPWDAVPPIWELRVGDYRVFYDVDQNERTVYVRAVRRKPPHTTTKEIL